MSIAWRELRRQPGRFLPVGGALTLLVVLLVVLGGFLDGLERSQTGAYRALDGSLLVLAEDAAPDVPSSRVPADAVDALAAVPGVASAGTYSQVATTAGAADRAGGTSADLQDVLLIGYGTATDRLPAPPPGGGAVLDATLAELLGVQPGDEVAVGPDATPVPVAAVLGDLRQGAPTMWVDQTAWRPLAEAANPFGVPAPGTAQALVVRPVEGTSATSIRQAVADAAPGVALTPDEVVEGLEVVAQQTATFQGILTVTFAVTLLVIALFFALITLERTALYAVLKAIGARSGDLLLGLSLQAVVIAAVALVVGIAAGLALVALLPPELPVQLLPTRLALIAAGTLATAVIGGLTTLRRILAIDPAASIG